MTIESLVRSCMKITRKSPCRSRKNPAHSRPSVLRRPYCPDRVPTPSSFGNKLHLDSRVHALEGNAPRACVRQALAFAKAGQRRERRLITFSKSWRVSRRSAIASSSRSSPSRLAQLAKLLPWNNDFLRKAILIHHDLLFDCDHGITVSATVTVSAMGADSQNALAFFPASVYPFARDSFALVASLDGLRSGLTGASSHRCVRIAFDR